MKYNVEIEFLQDGEMEKLEYCISDIELLDKFIPVEAIALLASFGMDYQIDELKEVVQEEGFADLEFHSGSSSLEISISED
jgi:hypothetical protein